MVELQRDAQGRLYVEKKRGSITISELQEACETEGDCIVVIRPYDKPNILSVYSLEHIEEHCPMCMEIDDPETGENARRCPMAQSLYDYWQERYNDGYEAGVVDGGLRR